MNAEERSLIPCMLSILGIPINFFCKWFVGRICVCYRFHKSTFTTFAYQIENEMQILLSRLLICKRSEKMAYCLRNFRLRIYRLLQLMAEVLHDIIILYGCLFYIICIFINSITTSAKKSAASNDTRWFKYDRDWFVCKQAALRSSCATLREWSHNLYPPSCSG